MAARIADASGLRGLGLVIIQGQRIKEQKGKELVLGEATDAETDAVAAAARAVVEGAGRAAVPGVVAPRPAAQQS